MVDLVFGDLVKVENCFATRGLAGNDEEWCKAHGSATTWYNPEKAKQILAEHGYGPDNPLEIILISYTGGNRDKVLEVFQQQLAAVNIKATIEMMDIGTLNARMPVENAKKDDSPGIAYNIGNGGRDIILFRWLFLCPGWVKGWCDPAADPLIMAMGQTTDQAKRGALAQQVMQIMFDQVVGVPLYTPGWEWMGFSKADVEGVILGPAMIWNFSDVRVPKR
jgi:peptide/nickel transport system substrate-binding protein